MNPQTVADWLIFNGAITAIVCGFLWLLDRFCDWNDRDIDRHVDAGLQYRIDRPDVDAGQPTDRPMHTWES